MVRKARIVATIGPSVDSEPVLRSLIQAGVDVARLNFSHGTHEEHLERIRLLRALSKEFDRPVTILQDLQGPKMRVGDLPDGGIPLKAGQVVLLAPTDSDGAEPPSGGGSIRIPMDVPQLARSVRPGNRVLLDDGQLELQVTEVRGDVVEARVMLGGLLKSHKGVNLPGASLDIPAFTEKDRLDLEFGLKHGIDVLAISFVRQPQDIEVVRHAIREIDPNKLDTPIIAKIERPEALDHLHEIIHAADGVMVARGDLAVETSPALVPIIQKRLIELAHRHAKIVIT
ncbi:MAG TPA: pyruvate kinase, partial [Anaerolineaceae bacterium]|nr:pyruvate kinase [Anaerolineaceae bacterium]